MKEKPQRSKPAHPPPVEILNEPVVLMVTVSLREGATYHSLDNTGFHEALLSSWARSQEWLPGYYMIMPDHLHFFCVPGLKEHPGVKAWCKKWKSLVSMSIAQKTWRWLPDCWDTQMRDYHHYVEKMEYVRRNPVRKGLVDQHAKWPYQGEVNVIRW